MAKHVVAVALIAFLLQGMLFHVAPLTIASALETDLEGRVYDQFASALETDLEHPWTQAAS